MTVCNIAFKPDEILILTDTLQYQNKKPVRLGGKKARIAPSGDFAVVTRGTVGYGDSVTDFLFSAPDFDTAEEWLPLAFAELVEAVERGQQFVKVEATLAGWSDRRDDLAVVRWKIIESTRVQSAEIGRGWSLEPCHPRVNLPADAENANPERMVKVALAQQMALNTMHDRNLCIGGRMTLTSITRAGITQHEIGRYPDYSVHAALDGDPLDSVEEMAA